MEQRIHNTETKKVSGAAACKLLLPPLLAISRFQPTILANLRHIPKFAKSHICFQILRFFFGFQNEFELWLEKYVMILTERL